MNTLIENLKLVKEFRRDQGKRHPLWLVLLIVIIGTMQGYLGYRALGDFAKYNQKGISQTFGIVPESVPSYSTIRRVMSGVDYQNLLRIFNDWASLEYGSLDEIKCLATDGKALNNTIVDSKKKQQNFVVFVSLFSTENGLVLHLKQFQNKKSSEIHHCQALVRDCQLENKIFTLDCLPGSKKDCEGYNRNKK